MSRHKPSRPPKNTSAQTILPSAETDTPTVCIDTPSAQTDTPTVCAQTDAPTDAPFAQTDTLPDTPTVCTDAPTVCIDTPSAQTDTPTALPSDAPTDAPTDTPTDTSGDWYTDTLRAIVARALSGDKPDIKGALAALAMLAEAEHTDTNEDIARLIRDARRRATLGKEHTAQ